MASTFSSLKLELIGDGEQSGTWGGTTNLNLGTAVEEAVTGSADVAFSGADVTLTLSNTNASQVARNLRLNLVGTSDGARQLVLGSGCQIDKLYLINNTLADPVTVRNTSGTGVTVLPNRGAFVFNDGTNVVETLPPADVTLNGAETLTNKTIAFGSNTLTDVASTNTTQTLTNKTIAFGSNTLTDVASTNTAQTLTNKTIAFGSNTVSGTLAEFNTSLSDGSFASLAGAETLTNKTLTSPVINAIVNIGTLTLPTASDTIVGRDTTDALTNKTIAFGSNTLTDVASTNTAQTLTNKTLTSPVLDGAPDQNGSYRSNIVAVAALDIDCTLGNYFTKTIDANSTFTFSNAPASRAYAFTLELTHTSGAVTWPASVRWPDYATPELTAGNTHLFVFITNNGGTTWRGAALVDYEN